LREVLAGGAGAGYALTVAAAPPINLLREATLPPRERPPVRRRKADGETALDDEAADDPQSRLDADVRAAIAGGARGLGAVTERVVAGRPEYERFVIVGRIAATVARVCDAEGAAERPWLAVDGTLVVEEWSLREAR
jgi:hypothetical protein